MIEGIHVDVLADEMKELLLGRKVHHEKKLSLYKQQLESMLATEAALKEETLSVGKFSNASPIKTMEESVERHTSCIAFYDFLAKHVVTGETYRLGQDDLRQLGIATSRF